MVLIECVINPRIKKKKKKRTDRRVIESSVTFDLYLICSDSDVSFNLMFIRALLYIINAMRCIVLICNYMKKKGLKS